jgi:hypothetical protein
LDRAAFAIKSAPGRLEPGEGKDQGEGSEMRSFSMLRASIVGAALVFTAAIGTTPAAAQHACQSDAFRLCNQFIPDRGRVASCLFRNKRALSPDCRVAMGGGKAKISRKAKGKRYGKRKRRR